MVQHDIHQMFITHLLVQSNDDQQVEALRALLSSLLEHPNVPKITGSISSHRQRLSLPQPHGFGVDNLTHTVLDLANRLAQTSSDQHAVPKSWLSKKKEWLFSTFGA